VLRSANIDRSRALRIVLGTVDVGPGSGVQNQVCGRKVGGRRRTDVPVSERERYDLVTSEGLDECPTKLAVRAGD
jgi:hypothetical protein